MSSIASAVPHRLRAALIALCACFAIAVVGPAPAQAAPPKGKYTCYQWNGSTFVYWGSIAILKQKRYKLHTGSKGKFRYSKSKKKITFRSGPLKRWKWYGLVDKASDGKPRITLRYDPDYIRIDCRRG